MLSRLFIAALWSPAVKGLTSWLSFVMFNCVFVIFPCDILSKVWYLIVSIPDLCQLSYFHISLCKCIDSPEPLLPAYIKYRCRPELRQLAPPRQHGQLMLAFANM